MEKIIMKGSTMLAPVTPALVTCGSMERPNVLTIAWTGIVNSVPPMTYISVRPERHSYAMIEKSGEFVINLSTVALARETDYCGVRSGRDEDKIAAAGLKLLPASKVACPIIAQCPVSLECVVRQRLPLGSHDMFLSEIVAVQVDASLMDERGKLHFERGGLLAYVHGEYFSLGKKQGFFGHSVRGKKAKRSPHRRADEDGGRR